MHSQAKVAIADIRAWAGLPWNNEHVGSKTLPLLGGRRVRLESCPSQSPYAWLLLWEKSLHGAHSCGIQSLAGTTLPTPSSTHTCLQEFTNRSLVIRSWASVCVLCRLHLWEYSLTSQTCIGQNQDDISWQHLAKHTLNLMTSLQGGQMC